MEERRIKNLYLLLVLVLATAALLFVFDLKLSTHGDNASYYNLGKSLANGQGYTYFNDPSQAQVKGYPPGYPLILSLVLRVFPDSITAGKIQNGFIYLVCVTALFLLFLEISPNIHIAFVSSLFAALNFNVLNFSTILLSEMSYLCCSTVAVFCFLKVDLKRSICSNQRFFIALMLLSISFYIRTAALGAIGGIFLYLLLQKKWPYVQAYLLGIFLLVMPWFIWGHMIGGNSYIQQLFLKNNYQPELGSIGIMDFIYRVMANVSRYITKEIPYGCFPFSPDNYSTTTANDWIIGLGLISLIILGVVSLKKHKVFIITYLLGIFVVLLAWPHEWIGPRFLFPVVPLLIFLTISGLHNLMNRAVLSLKVKSSFSPLLFLTILLFLFPGIQALHERAISEYPSEWKNYFMLARWARENLEKDVIIACRKPSLFAVFSDRYTVNYGFIEDDKKLLADLRGKKVTHVVWEQLGFFTTQKYLYPAMVKNKELFQNVAVVSNPDTILFRLVH